MGSHPDTFQTCLRFSSDLAALGQQLHAMAADDASVSAAQQKLGFTSVEAGGMLSCSQVTSVLAGSSLLSVRCSPTPRTTWRPTDLPSLEDGRIESLWFAR